MTPNDMQRYAIIWDTIERMAFKPDNPLNWFGIYERTLHRFWGLQPGDVRTRWKSGFDAHFLNISCEYNVENADRFAVTINSPAENPQPIWTVEVDPNFISKSSLHFTTHRYPHKDRNRHLRNDVLVVLDGMLFHPRHHCHLSNLGVTTILTETINRGVHEVRIGGGIENAFVSLYHLRYQFCIVSDEMREGERNRLTDLFTAAISGNRATIPANELFNFQN